MASAAHAMETKKMGTQALATFGVALLLSVAAYCALFVAPNEATMGLIQRIFYFHVPFGWLFPRALRLVGLRRLRNLVCFEHRLSAQPRAKMGLAGRVLRGSRRAVAICCCAP